jgi:stringent starvation protein B
MSEQEIKFLPYDEAIKIVAAIQEEEDLDDPNRRVLTVYNHEDGEVCWFDFEEVMEAVGREPKENQKERVTDYILRHLPDWDEER